MIKFFRKIRQNLLSEGKTGKYFKYAIGEIILVVIGILIALSINNWNEQNKTDRIENAFLKRLIVDLKKDKVYLESIHSRRESQIRAAKKIIDFSIEPKLDSIIYQLPNMLAISSWKETTSNQNTFFELISSGNLNIIKNDSIKDKLLRLDRSYNALINEDKVIKEPYVSNLWPAVDLINPYNYLVLDPNLNQEFRINERLEPNQIENMIIELKQDFKKVMDSKKFRSGLMNAMDSYERSLPVIEAMIEQVESLTSRIKIELKK
ncbi:DUF6090 family protein [uncultured Psychroserpens sp.]|uniref:DUF6090 family protein n=1 Tax=uncultured Psychroserpens sp. TaxID=255436 RepID=UPI00261D40BE|nr:DUF6090 family protein [uncultured Psychroserpens sp.]